MMIFKVRLWQQNLCRAKKEILSLQLNMQVTCWPGIRIVKIIITFMTSIIVIRMSLLALLYSPLIMIMIMMIMLIKMIMMIMMMIISRVGDWCATWLRA